MKIIKNILVFSIVVAGFTSCNNGVVVEKNRETKEELTKRVFGIAEAQYSLLTARAEKENPKLLVNPRSLNTDGKIRYAWREDWTSGFFPGTLWYIYEYSKQDAWKQHAEKFTEALDSAQFVKWHHDVGFMIQDSYGNGYRLTGNEVYKQAVIDAAKSLSTRYRPKAGIIQSWDTDAAWIKGRGLDMPVIIDNMMNLKLLYEATKFTGDTTFAHIANTHATTTIKNQYRKNYSSFHLIDYDHITGEVRSRVNFQGYSNPSSWARGQAWGLYGFTEIYRETRDKKFLNQANNIANYIMNTNKIPADKIPYWDYDDVQIPNVPRDASSAAITASALFDLAEFELDKTKKAELLTYAEDIIRELASERYLAKEGENGGFILMHSVGNIHENNENDTPLNYADYYFIEALIKWNNIK